LIVRAYETLKDPSKRYIYDLGEINPHFREDFKPNDDIFYTDFNDTASRRKYYDNKWYGFREKGEKTMKDEYFESRIADEEQSNSAKIVLFRLCFIAILIVLFDLRKQRAGIQHKAFRDIQKDLLKNQNDGKVVIKEKNTSFTMDLNEYIKEREKANSDEEIN